MDYSANETSVSSEVDDNMEFNIYYAIFIPILCFLIISGNLGTIYAFWKLPSLRDTPSELLVLSLSCADLITGSIVIPLFSPLLIIPGRWPLQEPICKFFGFVMNTCITASLLTLCQISIDRFLLVLKEYPQYIKIQSTRRIQITLAFGWILSLSIAAMELAIWDVSKTLDESASLIDYTKDCLSPARRIKWFSLTLFLAFYFLPVLLVCGLSTAFFYMLRQRLAKSWKMRAESQISKPSIKQPGQPSLSLEENQQRERRPMTSQEQQNKQYIKPAVTLLVLVSAMAICMLPYCMYVIVVEAGCRLCADYDILYTLLLLQFCNAGLDPFLYVMTQKQIQRFYKDRFKKLFGKENPKNRIDEERRRKIAIPCDTNAGTGTDATDVADRV